MRVSVRTLLMARTRPGGGKTRDESGRCGGALAAWVTAFFRAPTPTKTRPQAEPDIRPTLHAVKNHPAPWLDVTSCRTAIWTMNPLALLLLAQLAAPARLTAPVLSFPEPGLDEGAAYQGYQTRFYRDAAANTVQIYLDGREGRVVTLLADAENASVGFSARDGQGRPTTLRWGGDRAGVAQSGRTRVIEYALTADAPTVQLGWFLLGSMRVERDFQYEKRHRAPYAAAVFTLPETDRLVAALERLPADVQRRHLALLGASDIATLRARLRPTVTTTADARRWVARVVQPSLDGRDTMVVEVRVDPRLVAASRAGDSISLGARR